MNIYDRFISVVLTAVIISSLYFVPVFADSVILEDEFDAGVSQWNKLSGPSNSSLATAAEGKNNIMLIDSGTGTTTRNIMVTSGDLGTGDYTYSLRMKTDPVAVYTYVLFRVNSDKEFYGLWWDRYKASFSIIKSSLISPMNGNYVKSGSSVGFKANSWNNIKIVTSGNKANIYINDMQKPAFEMVDNDSPILSGGVGMAVYTGNLQASVGYFDDVKVTIAGGESQDYLGGAAASSDITGSSLKKAVDLLYNLNIMTPFEDGNFKTDSYVSRGEFADVLLKALNIDITQTDNDMSGVSIKDVDSDHTYVNSILKVVELGYMKCYDDDSFRPDNPIMFEDVVKILIDNIQYKYLAELKGGFPDGYLAAAAEVGITNNIKAKKGFVATRGVTAQLLYNAMMEPMPVLNSIGLQIDFDVYQDKTWLTERFKVKKGRGVVTSAQDAALSNYRNAGKGYVTIGDEKFDVGLTAAKDLLGYSVDYFYFDDDDDKYLVIINEASVNNVLSIEAEELISFSGNVYKYDEGGIVKEVSISKFTDVIYNGKKVLDHQNPNYRPQVGNINLIDNNNDGDYDVLKISSYFTTIVQSVNISNMTITDKFDSTKNIALKDCEYKIVNEKGRIIGLSNITEWSVLSVAASLDGKLFDIKLSNNLIQGSIDECSATENELVIDGGTYKISPLYTGEIPSPGEAARIYLDAFGAVAAIVKDNADRNKYAYLVEYEIFKKGVEEGLSLKVFDVSLNSMTVYKCAKKVIIDGFLCNSLEQIEDNITDETGALKHSITIIRTNSDKEVNYIDFPYTSVPKTGESANSLRLLPGSGSKLYFKRQTFSYSNMFYAMENTPLLCIPSDLSKENKFKTTVQTGTLPNEKELTIEAYSIEEDSFKADILIYNTDGTTTGNTSYPVIIEKVTKVLSDNGNETYKIYAADQSGKKVWIVSEDELANGLREEMEKVSPGDVIKFRIGFDSQIIGFVNKYFDVKTGQLKDSNDAYSAAQRVSTGYVYSLESGNIITIKSGIDESGSLIKPIVYEVLVTSGAKIYVVDTINKKIRSGTINDVYGYKQHGRNASKILSVQQYSAPLMIVVFE